MRVGDVIRTDKGNKYLISEIHDSFNCLGLVKNDTKLVLIDLKRGTSLGSEYNVVLKEYDDISLYLRKRNESIYSLEKNK